MSEAIIVIMSFKVKILCTSLLDAYPVMAKMRKYRFSNIKAVFNTADADITATVSRESDIKDIMLKLVDETDEKITQISYTAS